MSQIHGAQFSPVSFAHHLNLSANPFKSKHFWLTNLLLYFDICSTGLKMPKRRHLPNDARLGTIGMLEAGMRQVVVARRLGVSQRLSAAYELGWHKPAAL